MKERPIPFSGPMVRAILEGRKTQTRRAFRVQPPPGALVGWVSGQSITPYGREGDRLWVREAWKAHPTFDHLPPRDIPQTHVWYMADDGYKAESRYRQGMHMPRWASRITLEITGVRVERLKEISEEDAISEGIDPIPGRDGWWRSYRGDCVQHWDTGAEVGHRLASASFASLWESINGPESLAANPWVWVIEFKKLETPT